MLTLEQAKDRISELEGEVERLNALLNGTGWRAYEKLPLSGQERRILSLLIRTGEAPHDSIIDMLWGDRPNGGVDNPSDHIKVVVSKLRKKLAGLGVSIRTIYKFGYTMSKDDRRRIENLDAEEVFNAVKRHANIPLPQRPKVQRPIKPTIPRGDRPKGNWSW